jgi:hypothetical protein
MKFEKDGNKYSFDEDSGGNFYLHYRDKTFFLYIISGEWRLDDDTAPNSHNIACCSLFSTKPPINGWINTGKISKKEVDKIIGYLTDVYDHMSLL